MWPDGQVLGGEVIKTGLWLNTCACTIGSRFPRVRVQYVLSHNYITSAIQCLINYCLSNNKQTIRKIVNDRLTAVFPAISSVNLPVQYNNGQHIS